jgi:NADH-quinone oxidoreductase subunit N
MNDEHAAALVAQFGQLIPEMMLAMFACVLFLAGAFIPNVQRSSWGITALAGLLLALLALLIPPAYQPTAGAPFVFDSLAFLTRLIAIISGMVLIGLSWDELPERQLSDYYACLLVIVLGTGLVGAANDLVGLFIALEVVSIPTYILLYLPRHDAAAQEAALKYFLLSVFSSAFVLFGFSYLYGVGGTTNLATFFTELAQAPRDNPEQFSAARTASGLIMIAVIMVVAGLGFRITAVPFHFYAPDVYEGTSAGAAALLAMIPKVAGFAALLRVLGFVVPAGALGGGGTSLNAQLPLLLWFLAVLTMTLGNVMGLLQDNLRRLLAYSSVAHAGYMLVALASAPYLMANRVESGGVSALLYYLVAYGAMTVGVFTVIAMLHRPERPVETIDDLAGLSKSHPRIAIMLTILLLSLIGIPATAGFTGKLLIFFGALSVSDEPAAKLYTVLAVIGMINAAIGAWYYLRIISAMYLRTAVRPIATHGTISGLTALTVCVVLTVGLSVPPASNWLLRATRQILTPPAIPGPAAQARLGE